MLLSERQNIARGEHSLLPRTDIFPLKTRQQCWQCWQNSYPSLDFSYKFDKDCEKIVEYLRERNGLEVLTKKKKIHPYNDLPDYPLELKEFFFEGLEAESSLHNVEHAFSILELICRISSQASPNKKVVDKINEYLRLSAIGYNYHNNQLRPYQDENFNSFIILPALSILNNKVFGRTYEKVQEAFDHLKNGKFEAAVSSCGSALELLLKSILDIRNIKYHKDDNLKALLPKTEKFILIEDINFKQILSTLNLSKNFRNKAGGHSIKSTPNKNFTDLALGTIMTHMKFIADSYLENNI